jgi:hypothetical protein
VLSPLCFNAASVDHGSLGPSRESLRVSMLSVRGCRVYMVAVDSPCVWMRSDHRGLPVEVSTVTVLSSAFWFAQLLGLERCCLVIELCCAN